MKRGFEVEDGFSESAVGREHIHILHNRLELQGTHWLKRLIVGSLSPAGPVWGSIDQELM